MPSLFEKISFDLREAQKTRDVNKTSVLRMVLAQIHNLEIEKGLKEEGLSDEEILGVVKKEGKKRKEAAEIYRKGGREDLAKKEEAELGLIEKYLPEQVSPEVIEQAVDEVIQGGERDFGAVMKKVMARFPGVVEGSVVSGIVKKKLG